MINIKESDAGTGELNILFQNNDAGDTYVSKQNYKLPMQAIPLSSRDSDGTAFLNMLTPDAGLLSNDRIKIRIELEDESKALVTASINKIYKTEEGHATQVIDIKVGSGAVLEYLPQQNAPFAGSKFLQRVNFRIMPDSTLLAWDIVSPDRAQNGDRFDFDLYFSETNLFIDGKLELCEKSRLEPSSQKAGFESVLYDLGLFEGKDTAGTIIIYSPNVSTEILDMLYVQFKAYSDLLWGASVVSDNLIVVKFLGDRMHNIRDALYDVWNGLRQFLLGKEAVDFRRI